VVEAAVEGQKVMPLDTFGAKGKAGWQGGGERAREEGEAGAGGGAEEEGRGAEAGQAPQTVRGAVKGGAWGLSGRPPDAPACLCEPLLPGPRLLQCLQAVSNPLCGGGPLPGEHSPGEHCDQPQL